MLDWKLARLADMAATNLKLVTDKQGMVADVKVLERRLKVVEAKPEVQAFVDVAGDRGKRGSHRMVGHLQERVGAEAVGQLQ